MSEKRSIQNVLSIVAGRLESAVAQLKALEFLIASEVNDFFSVDVDTHCECCMGKIYAGRPMKYVSGKRCCNTCIERRWKEIMG
jgi:hypothetical protein